MRSRRVVDECGRDVIAMTGTKAVQTPRGRRTAVGVDKFPRSGRKPLRGVFIRLLGANAVHVGWCGQIRMFGTTTARRGVRPALGSECRLWGRKRPMSGRRGRVPMFGTKAVQRGVYSARRGRCGPWAAGMDESSRPGWRPSHEHVRLIPKSRVWNGQWCAPSPLGNDACIHL